MSNNKKNSKPRIPSIEETNAMLEKEFAEQGSKAEESPPKEGESKALDKPKPTSSVLVLADKSEEMAPDISALGSDQRPLRETAFVDNEFWNIRYQYNDHEGFPRNSLPI